MIDGRIQPSITSIKGPDGKAIKLKQNQETESLNLDSADLVIENPEDGTYTITLNSPYKEDYEIAISYLGPNNDGFADSLNYQ